MKPFDAEILGTVLFGLAILHTFLVGQFEKIALRFTEGSIGENFFHFLGEVEVVFGVWAGVLVALLFATQGPESAFLYIEGLNFSEPLFVFSIMTVAATRPIIHLARHLILSIAQCLPLQREIGIYISCLIVGPLLGSVITEPAAMTVTALILRDRYYLSNTSKTVKYLTLGVLLVNISIGGVLTSFAAPPILMVSGKWGWDTLFVLKSFGWKAVIGTFINAGAASWYLRNDLSKLNYAKSRQAKENIPGWLIGLHLIFLLLIVLLAHHPVLFMGLLLFFIGVAAISRRYQDDLKLRESLLVAFFLAGLIVLGGLQAWWLKPILVKLDALFLFFGSTTLTALTDNAALTYLGSQVDHISDANKYTLVAGAVSGGGLTVIANAPNPAGFAILRDNFGSEGISPFKLLTAAILPTLVAMSCFWLL